MNRLKIIRILRSANYSLEAILRLLNSLDQSQEQNIKSVLNQPDPDEDIISVCDRFDCILRKSQRKCPRINSQDQAITKTLYNVRKPTYQPLNTGTKVQREETICRMGGKTMDPFKSPIRIEFPLRGEWQAPTTPVKTRPQSRNQPYGDEICL